MFTGGGGVFLTLSKLFQTIYHYLRTREARALFLFDWFRYHLLGGSVKVQVSMETRSCSHETCNFDRASYIHAEIYGYVSHGLMRVGVD